MSGLDVVYELWLRGEAGEADERLCALVGACDCGSGPTLVTLPDQEHVSVGWSHHSDCPVLLGLIDALRSRGPLA